MESSHKPRVSIICPNYNYARYLNQRLDSILAQTYTDFELILLDDASTDDSSAIIESYRSNPRVSAVCVNQQNSGGVFHQWEKGLSLAKGDLVWIAEADDYAAPDFLQKCVEVIDANPDVVVCQTGAHCVDENGQHIDMTYDRWSREGGVFVGDGMRFISDFLRWFNILYNASGIVFRRSAIPADVFAEVRKFKGCGDWLFWIRMAANGRVAVIRERLNFFRKSRISVSAVNRPDEELYVFLWLCNNGFFKRRSLAWAVNIGKLVREVRHNGHSHDIDELKKRCNVSCLGLYYHVFILVRFFDNIKRGWLFAPHRRV